MIRRLICLDFRAFGCSGEEGRLEQDGNVYDKRNSSDFIVPPRHTTNVSFETRSNTETQDWVYREKNLTQRKWKKEVFQQLYSTEVSDRLTNIFPLLCMKSMHCTRRIDEWYGWIHVIPKERKCSQKQT